MNYDITDAAPEHKAGIAVRDEFDELRATFEQFKAANDERLAAIERRRPDPLLEEKVERINAAVETHSRRFDEMSLMKSWFVRVSKITLPRDDRIRELVEPLAPNPALPALCLPQDPRDPVDHRDHDEQPDDRANEARAAAAGRMRGDSAAEMKRRALPTGREGGGCARKQHGAAHHD